MKRGRNQRRRQGVNPNRALDSNGPDVRIRGTANQIYDKYQTLARDAASSGDRVKAESYLQHAEHYFRLIRSMQPAQPPQQQGADAENEQPVIESEDAGEGAGARRLQEPKNDTEQSGDAAADANGVAEPDREPKTADEPANDAAEAETADEPAAEEKKPRRRRTRRPTKRASDAEEKSDVSDPEPAAAE